MLRQSAKTDGSGARDLVNDSPEPAVSTKQKRMETKTYCAYNVSRSRHLSPKVTVVDRADQPLTLMRLLIESLGFKAETSLWLNPVCGVPSLVKPFPFDLVYLDKDLKVLRAAELMPEVPFPVMGCEVTTALALPLRTLSSTGTQEGDRLVVCAEDELEQRLEEILSTEISDSTSSKTDEFCENECASTEAEQKSLPMREASEPVLALTTTQAGPQGLGFTVALTTRWQITNSTTSAAAPGNNQVKEDVPEVKAPTTAVDSVAELATENETAEVAPSVSAAESETEVAESTPVAEPAPIEAVESQSAEKVESPPVVETESRSNVAESVPSDQTESAEGPDELQVEAKPVAEETERLAVSAEIVADVANNARPEARKPVSEEAPVQPSVTAATMHGPSVTAEPTTAMPALHRDRSAEHKEVETPKRNSVEAPARSVFPANKRAPQKNKPEEQKPREPEEQNDREEEKKDHLGIRVIRWLNLEDPRPDRRSKKRYLMPGLFAYDAAATEAKAYEVRDVGPAGLYVKTPKRGKPGQLISLRLCCEDAKEKTSASSVKVQAQTVRSDKEGTVLSFVFPEAVEFEPWNRLHTRKSSETDAEYFVRELRLAKAFGFLRRICESATEQIRLALHERFSNKRLASATEIALQAEEMLSRCEETDIVAHPHVLMRILEEGSWAQDDWVRQMWAGLLATSCTADGQDTSNMALIDLLDKLTPIHLKVLAFACRKGAEAGASGELLANFTVYCSGDELVQVVGSNNLARIQQTIGHLAGYGLLAESARPSYVGAMEKIKTKATPTELGRRLHARCSGQRA